jgi:hypothetical protein
MWTAQQLNSRVFLSFFLSEYTKEAEPFHRLSCHTWQLASHTLAVSQLEPDPDKLWEQP